MSIAVRIPKCKLIPVPRDGRLLALILASKGIQDADERVIHQLLDFAYRKFEGPRYLDGDR